MNNCPKNKLCNDDNCKECFNKSFASHEKSKYWSNKNELTPRKVFKSTAKKYLFNCDCSHEFISRLDNIINGNWCAYCSNNKLCNNDDCKDCYEKSFASHEKAKYWSSKNELTARQIFKNSNKKYLFECDCSHEIMIANNQINRGGWCSFCSNPPQQLCDNDNCGSCFEKSFASHEKVKYWSNKNNLKPRQVFKSSGKKYIFNCECNHEIELALHSNTWCAYCANQKLCSNKDCNECFEKSFASHEKSKYWSDKNKLKPRDIFKYSNLKYIFNCNKCNHSFDKIIGNICNKNGWCPYCSYPCKKLCDSHNCQFCFNNSFASHEKSKEFSNKNKTNPRYILKGSNDKYIFECKKCNHEYESIIANESWCGYCGNKKLCENNDCDICFEKSFASHEKSKYWSDKNELKPRQVFRGSQTKYIFNCNKCNNKFKTSINKITGSNRWCPYCKNKTEKKLYEKLLVIYPNLIHQYKVEWCKNKTYLPFDFVLEDIKIIIELDGGQHFKQVRDWKSPEEQQQNDKYKMECANINGFSVIRILQEDVYNDLYDWLNELKNNIDKIIKDQKIQNIYMCKNNEYDIFN
jgi:very-short-patch-repair endonuclease